MTTITNDNDDTIKQSLSTTEFDYHHNEDTLNMNPTILPKNEFTDSNNTTIEKPKKSFCMTVCRIMLLYGKY